MHCRSRPKVLYLACESLWTTRPLLGPRRARRPRPRLVPSLLQVLVCRILARQPERAVACSNTGKQGNLEKHEPGRGGTSCPREGEGLLAERAPDAIFNTGWNAMTPDDSWRGHHGQGWGGSRTLADILDLAKFNDRLQFIQDAVDAALIQQAAKELGIEVSRGRPSRRRMTSRPSAPAERGRHRAVADGETAHLDEWASMIEGWLLARRVRDAVTKKKNRAVPRPASSRLRPRRRLPLLAAEEEIARELRAQIADDEADFHALARKHSIETATRPWAATSAR